MALFQATNCRNSTDSWRLVGQNVRTCINDSCFVKNGPSGEVPQGTQGWVLTNWILWNQRHDPWSITELLSSTVFRYSESWSNERGGNVPCNIRANPDIETSKSPTEQVDNYNAPQPYRRFKKKQTPRVGSFALGSHLRSAYQTVLVMRGPAWSMYFQRFP